MDRRTEQALLRAVCALIDTGRFELGKEETDDPTEQAVVDFMRQLRIGSRVTYGGSPNTWKLPEMQGHGALVQSLRACVRELRDPRGSTEAFTASVIRRAEDALALVE
jgi:hypothetical protein